MSNERGSWALVPDAFLTRDECEQLRSAGQTHARRARRLNRRDWFLVDLAMSSGLRVAELAALRIRDFRLDASPAVRVGRGKGGKARVVLLDHDIAEHARAFLQAKPRFAEPVDPSSPVFWSTRSAGALSVRALQRAFKRIARLAGLPTRYSIHSLRHTYATHLYVATENNLLFVQRQLGHAKVTTTQVYASVLLDRLGRSLRESIYTP